jgi:NADPH:quinone reductase-like Zn-dependent oxidoreductase
LRLDRLEVVKTVLIDRYGAPDEVARCADVPDVGTPGAGEVVFDVLAFPINPADISFCRGTYRVTRNDGCGGAQRSMPAAPAGTS